MFGWNANPDAQPLPEIEGHIANSRLERVLRAGDFAVTAELAPPDSGNADDVYKRAEVFDGVVDGMNATDGSGANCHMSSVGMCALLTNAGYSPVMQISCRDRNRIAIQGDVLGAYAMGVRNVLCLSGDGVQVGDHPQAKPVFDLDSISLLETIRIMRDESRYLSGREITTPPKMLLGAAENPCAPPYDFRPYRLAKKIAAGANFIQTQYIFDVDRLKEFLAKSRDLGLLEHVFILPGVGPIASARTALWITKNVPGIYIPDDVIKRLEGAEDQKREGQNICVELIQQISELEGVSGVHVMAYRQEESVRDIIQRSGVLGKRVPWYPGQNRENGTEDSKQTA
jgi:methylenetetrahydrofolate reductase (NADPH)